MKKIITLLLAAGSFTFASAQTMPGRKATKDMFPGRSDHSNDYYKKTANNNSNFLLIKERDQQIQKVNHEFDMKIAFVKRDRWMKSKEKSKQIKLLEKQRNLEIKQVQVRYASKVDSYNGNGYSKNNNKKW